MALRHRKSRHRWPGTTRPSASESGRLPAALGWLTMLPQHGANLVEGRRWPRVDLTGIADQGRSRGGARTRLVSQNLGTGTFGRPLTGPWLVCILRRVALEGTEAVVPSAVDALDEAFFVMSAVRDASGGIVDFEYAFCNQRALQVLGRRRDEVVGRRLLDLFPSHRTNGLFETFTGVTETGEPARLEFSFEEGGVVGDFEAVVSRVGD